MTDLTYDDLINGIIMLDDLIEKNNIPLKTQTVIREKIISLVEKIHDVISEHDQYQLINKSSFAEELYHIRFLITNET